MPQAQVQPSAGRGLPQAEQNFPVFLWPQVHVQPFAAGCGFFAQQLGQKLPVAVAPQLHFQPSAAGAAGAAFCCWPMA